VERPKLTDWQPMSAPDFTLNAEAASSLQRVGRRTGLEPSVNEGMQRGGRRFKAHANG
jgi:hypothetical protein